MTAEIELKNVTYAKAGREIIAPLSLTLRERRIGIVGRNGSGKSTLARLIAGLIAPGQGDIRVCGIDVFGDRKGALGSVGVLFQNPDHQIIFPTVLEELSFGLRQMGQSAGEADGTAKAMLARFGRSAWAGRPVHSLSQGQRHLVCLMSVLAMAPRVILLDEPFSGLDLPTRLHLTRMLDSLDQSLIHITHQTGSLAAYDRVIWLEAGKVTADGPPQLVLPEYEKRMSCLGSQDALADI